MSWKDRSLDELGFIGRGRSRHRPRDAEHLYGGDYPFIQTSDVKHASLYINEFSQTYSEAGLAQSKLWKTGTLCITIAANIADTAILGIDACFPDSVIGFVADPNKADTRFVKYLFDALLQKRFKQFTQGAAQDNLSQSKLLSLSFPIPESVSEQKAIASILSAYDDLIENNRRRIQLLEESARLLFKEWFVHLRFPGHEHVQIVDGVPEGWERSTVGQIAKIQSGFAFKSKDWLSEGNPVIKIKNLVGDGTINTSECDCVDDTVAEKAHRFLLSPGNLLIAMTGATVGKTGLMPRNDKTFYLNQRVGVFQSLIKMKIEYFLYPFLMEDMAITQVQNLAGGAAQPNISSKQIESIELLIPDNTILDLYLDSVSKQFLLREIAIEQIERLKQARDLLLPRLMNGEINL